MASGDDIQAGRITAAEETTDLIAQIPTADDPPPFNGDVIFRVSPQQAGETKPSQTLNAIWGKGGNGLVPSPGGTGVTGIGSPNQGTGVVGRGGGDDQGQGGIGVHGKGGAIPGLTFGLVNPGAGVLGQGGLQDDLSNVTGQPHAAGIIGIAGSESFPSFQTIGGAGVFGQGASAERKTVSIDGQPGVSGPDKPGPGILGRGALQNLDGSPNGNPSVGVIGLAGDVQFPPFSEASNAGIYGRGKLGVFGVAGGDLGDIGAFDFGIGVFGATSTVPAAGVTAISINNPDFPTLLAINGASGRESGVMAALFIGNTVATGTKSAAVPHPDGLHRLLYTIESPECWFEDFGEGQLSMGKAEVRLDPEFASLVFAEKYHVFITPYGESNGLFVTDRSPFGFCISEQQGGVSNVNFAYRVIAKRRDIAANRLAAVALPKIPGMSREDLA